MTKKEREHLRKVAELCCIVCRKMGYYDSPAEIHHIKKGIMSKRSTHYETIPLCPYHHRTSKESYHQNPKEFTEKWGTQEELLDETLRMIYGEDKIKQG